MRSLGKLDVSYGQVSVFWAILANPFNDWSEAHVRQGFAWRPGSVSFKTLDDGPMDVSVTIGASAVSADASRVIRVPFTIEKPGDLEVATIGGTWPLKIEPGEYALTFEHGLSSSNLWCHFIFHRVRHAIAAAILVADAELAPPPALLLG